tara:strand:+ start:851 stop:1150 length:300 start_codon:yes stop_codon:yes gene_type:complete
MRYGAELVEGNHTMGSDAGRHCDLANHTKGLTQIGVLTDFLSGPGREASFASLLRLRVNFKVATARACLVNAQSDTSLDLLLDQHTYTTCELAPKGSGN